MGNTNPKCSFKTKNCSDLRLSHLPTAELQENVYVFLVFKVMRKFHDVLVRERFVQLDLVCDL